MREWPVMTLGQICAEGGGFIRTGPFGSQLHQSDYVDDPNGIPVVMPKDMSEGRVHRSTIARIGGDTADRLSHHLLAAGDIALSRRGDVGRSAWIGPEDLPVLCGTGSMRVHPGRPRSVHPAYLRYFFRSRHAIDYLEGQAVGATMPNLNAGIVTGMPVPVLPYEFQRFAAEVLQSIDDLIDNDRRRVEVLEEAARGIYREWFVHFRYPGHEDVPLVDSPFDPIPSGWAFRPVRQTAAAISAGPFGSKLGRKDYVADGVPVIRGANLEIGGGFDESDFVYVTPAKADELHTCLAFRGDIVITQRGTLGQIGLIPETSTYERYILSQSQMKVTVDAKVGSPEFVYRQMSTPETCSRFISQAISTGVPHVNLALLRDFPLLMAPIGLQHRFALAVRDLDRTAWSLRAQADVLTSIRDSLLPRLIAGQIDVSDSALDPLREAVLA